MQYTKCNKSLNFTTAFFIYCLSQKHNDTETTEIVSMVNSICRKENQTTPPLCIAISHAEDFVSFLVGMW